MQNQKYFFIGTLRLSHCDHSSWEVHSVSHKMIIVVLFSFQRQEITTKKTRWKLGEKILSSSAKKQKLFMAKINLVFGDFPHMDLQLPFLIALLQFHIGMGESHPPPREILLGRGEQGKRRGRHRLQPGYLLWKQGMGVWLQKAGSFSK